MTNNTAHHGDCLFLQIWPKIKECSFLQALYVCPNQMTSEDILLICSIRALTILYGVFFLFLCGNITCVWYSGGRCPPGGGEMSWAAASFLIWTEH